MVCREGGKGRWGWWVSWDYVVRGFGYLVDDCFVIDDGYIGMLGFGYDGTEGSKIRCVKIG